MELNKLLTKLDVNIIIFLLTSLFAFLAWIIKGLIEKPLNDSKISFEKHTEKRIEILTEFKTRLQFIAYFPSRQDSIVFKTQLQDLLLKDGRAGYLNKKTYDSILKICITPQTNETLLLNTIQEIDNDLANHILKIKTELQFYRRFSNYDPIRRFVGYTYLTILYITTFAILVSIFFFVPYAIFYMGWWVKICIIIILFIIICLIYKWFNK